MCPQPPLTDCTCLKCWGLALFEEKPVSPACVNQLGRPTGEAQWRRVPLLVALDAKGRGNKKPCPWLDETRVDHASSGGTSHVLKLDGKTHNCVPCVWQTLGVRSKATDHGKNQTFECVHNPLWFYLILTTSVLLFFYFFFLFHRVAKVASLTFSWLLVRL